MFFDVSGDDAHTCLFEFSVPRQKSLVYLFFRDIVEVIIGQQLLHPDDVDSASREISMASLKQNMHALEDARSSNRVSEFTVTIANFLKFRMIVRFLAVGLSFRQCVSVLESAKTETGMAAIGSCHVKHVVKLAHFLCAVNLQTIPNLLSYCGRSKLRLKLPRKRAPSIWMFVCRSAGS